MQVFWLLQLNEYKTKMKEVQADLQRQMQAAKKVNKMLLMDKQFFVKTMGFVVTDEHTLLGTCLIG